jgi:hypothetical protein
VTSLALRPDLTEINTLAGEVESFGTTHGITPIVISVVQLALEDVMTAFSTVPGDIHVQLAIENGAWLVRAHKVADESFDIPLDLVSSLVDEVNCEYADGQHRLTLRKALQ